MKPGWIHILLLLLLSVGYLNASNIDSLQNELTQAEGIQKVEILYSLAATYERIKPEDRSKYANLGYHLAVEYGNDSLIAVGLKNIAVSKYYLNDFDSTTYYFQVALEKYKQNNDTFGISVCLGNLGMLYQNNLQYQMAINYILETKELKENIKDSIGMITVYLNLVSLYYEMDDTYQALKYNKLVQHLTQVVETLPTKYFPSISLNFGAIYLRLAQNQISPYFQNIENILNHKETYLLNDSAKYFIKLAEENYRESLEYFESNNDSVNIALILKGIGNLYMTQKKFLDAMATYNKSIKYFHNANMPLEVARVYINLAHTYLRTNQYKEAITHYEIADSMANRYNFFDVSQKANEALYKYYYMLGDKSKAIEPLLKLQAISDSINIQDIKHRLNQFKAQETIKQKDYQIQLLEKDKEVLAKERIILFISVSIVILLVVLLYARFRYKTKTNKLLEKKNLTLQQLNLELEQSKENLTETNIAKDKMFSLIAHDLRNPIGSFKMMVNMLSEDYDQISEEERKEFVDTLKTSSINVYSLMENLLTWSRSQRGKIECNPEVTNLFRLAENTKNNLTIQANSKNIYIYNLIKPEYSAFIDPNLTSTIIRNLISNSIKFSNEHTNITIEYKTDENNFAIISIRDEGVGMTQEQINKLFDLDSSNSTKGTKNEEGTGLGLLLCKEFAELQNGFIRVESQINVGTVFFVHLPKIAT